MDLPDALTRVPALLLAALLVALVLAPAAAAAPAPVYDSDGNLVQTPFAPPQPEPKLDEERAVALFLKDPKVASWLERYPPNPTTDADRRDDGNWTVRVWSGEAGQVALGVVDDAGGVVTEAWTGPQVAWKMARGYDGAFGGKTINERWVWLAFCAVFLLGLGNLRRPLSLRNLDLLALLAFTPSLYFFNRGEVFWSVPLAIPPLLYVIGRLAWIGARGRPTRTPPTWPAWVLLAATVFLLGFRIGLNVQAPYSVIDVGYAGVIGAHRIANGEAPYGHFPVQDTRPACGPADAEGEIRNRIQTNGRCESSNERGDTYGPVSYLAYVPGFALFGWSGKWGGDTLPAAHFTSLAWDLLIVAGLVLVGRRYGGNWLAAALAFAWAAYPFTQYTSNSNTNDAIPAAFLVWGFWLATSPWARGTAVALSGWTKFSTLIVAPLWLTYPTAPRARPLVFVAAFLARHRGGLLDPPARARSRRGGAHVRRPDVPLAARPRVALLALGLGPVPRRGDPRPEARPARAPGARRRGRDRRRVRAAAQVAAPARGAHRRPHRRLRARARALVVPLHPLVLRLRGVRVPRGAAAPGAGTGPARGAGGAACAGRRRLTAAARRSPARSR